MLLWVKLGQISLSILCKIVLRKLVQILGHTFVTKKVYFHSLEIFFDFNHHSIEQHVRQASLEDCVHLTVAWLLKVIKFNWAEIPNFCTISMWGVRADVITEPCPCCFSAWGMFVYFPPSSQQTAPGAPSAVCPAQWERSRVQCYCYMDNSHCHNNRRVIWMENKFNVRIW